MMVCMRIHTTICSILVAACTSSSSNPSGPCETATTAFCDANYACDTDVAYHAQCLADSATYCAAHPSGTVDEANTCYDLWWGSTCDVAGPAPRVLEWTPEDVSCVESFWPCGIEGGTSVECEGKS
jgi:hypothetical protein